jgi:hypothetical protein
MHLLTSINYKKIISNISKIGYASQTLLQLFQETISNRTKEAKQKLIQLIPRFTQREKNRSTPLLNSSQNASTTSTTTRSNRVGRINARNCNSTAQHQKCNTQSSYI